jgi:SAM-dependent methyltransferase
MTASHEPGMARESAGLRSPAPAAHLPAAPLIASIGAAVDAKEFEAGIRDSVKKKLESGIYSAELLSELTPDEIRDTMRAFHSAIQLSIDPPLGSHRPLAGKLVSFLKRLITAFLRWHTRWIIGQVQTMGASTEAVLESLDRRLRDQERRFDRLAAQVAWDRSTGLVRGDAQAAEAAEEVWGWAACSEELLGLDGRVVAMGTGVGELLAMLQAAGIPGYAVDGDQSRAERLRSRGVEVHLEDPVRHLAKLAPGSLAAVVGVGTADQWQLDAAGDLFRAAADALTPQGLLILVMPAGETPVGPESDPAGVDGVPFSFLASTAGFREVKVEHLQPGGDEGCRLPHVADDSSSPSLIQSAESTVERLERVVFGPPLVKMVARR